MQRIKEGEEIEPANVPPSMTEAATTAFLLWDRLRKQAWVGNQPRGITETDLSCLWVNIGAPEGNYRLRISSLILELESEFHRGLTENGQ